MPKKPIKIITILFATIIVSILAVFVLSQIFDGTVRYNELDSISTNSEDGVNVSFDYPVEFEVFSVSEINLNVAHYDLDDNDEEEILLDEEAIQRSLISEIYAEVSPIREGSESVSTILSELKNEDSDLYSDFMSQLNSFPGFQEQEAVEFSSFRDVENSNNSSNTQSIIAEYTISQEFFTSEESDDIEQQTVKGAVVLVFIEDSHTVFMNMRALENVWDRNEDVFMEIARSVEIQ